MNSRSYWLDLFTWTTWQEFLAAGGKVSGFAERRWSIVRQIRPGDYLLCYLTGISRWVGLLEVVLPPFRDDSPIWNATTFPCRVGVKVLAQLAPETAVPVLELRPQLSIFQNLKSPIAWTGHFRGSPQKWKPADGEAVVAAVMDALRNPVSREVDRTKLYRTHKLLIAKMGPVTIPEVEDAPQEPAEEARELTAHAEMQGLLLKLGSDMGLDVWVARNDRGRSAGDYRFADTPRLKKELPLQFDEATNRTVELIDVLWLRGNAIAAAFEIESTTTIYSGLLRMSDLIAMQPNLNIPLYLVAPDDRRDKVITEVNRPTFSRLSPPMNRMCRFIPFSALRQRLTQVGPLVKYLKPDFLEGLSESCELDGA